MNATIIKFNSLTYSIWTTTNYDNFFFGWNIKLLNEYIDEFSGPVLRFFFLKSQYRSPQEFNVNLLKESESTLNNLIDFTYGVDSELKSKEVLDIFEDSMNEDLNTPKMLGSLFKLIKESDTLNEQKLSELKSSIKFVFNVFMYFLRYNIFNF